MAKVVAVNRSEIKGIPKEPVGVGEFIADFGLEGDVHAGNWHRQVSMLGTESIGKAAAMGATGLGPGTFAENITTEGIELYSLAVGTRLRVGGVVLEVTQIGKECHRKCNIYQQIGDCVMPREGIFARVIQGGSIQPNDEIVLL